MTVQERGERSVYVFDYGPAFYCFVVFFLKSVTKYYVYIFQSVENYVEMVFFLVGGGGRFRYVSIDHRSAHCPNRLTGRRRPVAVVILAIYNFINGNLP